MVIFKYFTAFIADVSVGLCMWLEETLPGDNKCLLFLKIKKVLLFLLSILLIKFNYINENIYLLELNVLFGLHVIIQ